MAEEFGFYDPVLLPDGTYDREYNAKNFSVPFNALINTGVMKKTMNELFVTSDGLGMITKIDTGIAFINGRYYKNTSFKTHQHDTESVGVSRIDRIVIRMNEGTDYRSTLSYVKKGAPSTNPVAPTLVQTESVYEISLAQVKIVGGQTFIAANAVTDERGTDIICPWAGSNILPNFDNATLEEFILEFNAHVVKIASTTEPGHVKLNDTLTSTAKNEAATANTVRQLYSIVSNDSVSIGKNSYPGVSPAFKAIAIGSGAEALNPGAIALGAGSKAEGANAINIGYGNYAFGDHAVSIGSGVPFSGGRGLGVLGGPSSNANCTNTWKVNGSFSVVGTKNFEIPHPSPDKKHTHIIRHGAVESPTAGDTLYRYTIKALTDGETVEVQLPDYFEYLNTNVDVYVSPHKHFGRAFGEVIDDKLLVTCEKLGTYKALIIGTRNDDNVHDWYIKGVEREIGESWEGETYVFEVDEITEVTEFEEVVQ